MKTVTLGGNRLGSGKKMQVDLHGFERSTHDLGYVWRNTQAPGTLVPFMVQLALPGDSFDINLGADVKTHPTTGPLFGSFKLQLDVFECPIRLYHSWLHNNKLGIGKDMSSVLLPQLRIYCNPLQFNTDSPDYCSLENQQINQSSLLAYLGLRGVGKGQYDDVYQYASYKNAIPLLSYWDIYKNYYANKQEEIGMVIHSNNLNPNISDFEITVGAQHQHSYPYNLNLEAQANDTISYQFAYYGSTQPTQVKIGFYNKGTMVFTDYPDTPDTIVPIPNGWAVIGSFNSPATETVMSCAVVGDDALKPLSECVDTLGIISFPLSAIDDMRETILAENNNVVLIDSGANPPYNLPFEPLNTFWSTGHMCSVCKQDSLALKTYQSDIFNNWLNTEWIDGAGGINEITAIDTSSGSFDINTLNLAQKVYDMLNRIAVTGGTYDDWLEAVYDHEPFRKCESPIYHGGLSKEIIFQEVVSHTQTDEQPLGTLGGKGGMSTKHKGGQVNIKVNEPSYLIGIVSITPRIDYFQGNEFFTSHTTLNDIHKPSLDEIGFQDLITDKMAFWDTSIQNGTPTYKSAGKQPAWLDYMTNYNRLYGNFASETNEMFMTLARRYEPDQNGDIDDLTTYIDPSKFNYAFAETDLSSMNFWVQIGVDMIARRKMSAKLMPNL